MKNAHERITDSITELIFKDNYWGYLFIKMNRKENNTIDAAMGITPEMDGSITLLYNSNFIDSMDDNFLNFAIEHEGMHILNKHIPRLLRIISDEVNLEIKNEKSKKWNIASDCSVNSLLNANKTYYLEIDGNKIPYELYTPDYFNLPARKSSEYYYENIPDDKSNNNENDEDKNNSAGESSSNTDESKNNSSGGNGDLEGDEFGGESSSNTDGSKNGFGKGNSNKSIDDHDSWIANNSSVSDISSLASRLEEYTNSIIEGSYNSVKRKGNLPGYIIEKVEEILRPPQIPYYQMISKLVKGSRKSKFKRAYSRINKKRSFTFLQFNKSILPFPGKKKDFSFNISVILDTSGSMSKGDIMEGLSSVKNIIENDKDCETTIIECDTKIHKEYKVKKLKDIDFSVKGRGGTYLFPAISRCKELKTDVTLIFTDGYCENVNEINRKLLPNKMIYIITNNGTSELVDKTGYVVRLEK